MPGVPPLNVAPGTVLLKLSGIGAALLQGRQSLNRLVAKPSPPPAASANPSPVKMKLELPSDAVNSPPVTRIGSAKAGTDASSPETVQHATVTIVRCHIQPPPVAAMQRGGREPMTNRRGHPRPCH